MAADIVRPPQNFPPLDFVLTTTTEGVPVMVPAATIAHLREQGGGDITVKVAGLPTSEHDHWVTLKAAAVRYLKDRPDLAGLSSAKTAVRRAYKSGEITGKGTGRDTRIDPESLDAWRLQQRDRYLAALDRQD